MQYNRLGDAGLWALATALEQNDSLTHLNLGVRLQRRRVVGEALTPLVQGNNFSNDGARALAAALEQNGSLAYLNLGVRVLLIGGRLPDR